MTRQSVWRIYIVGVLKPLVVQSARAGDASQRRLSFVSSILAEGPSGRVEVDVLEDHDSKDKPYPCSSSSSSVVAVAATLRLVGVSANTSGQPAAQVQCLDDDLHGASGAPELHSESEDEGLVEC